MSDLVSPVGGVSTERFVPKIANQAPHLRVRWNESKISVAALMQKLRDGDPSIELVPDPEAGVEIAAWMLQPGEAEIIGRRIRQILSEAA
jgi:L-seryl-tRNA(Ser) seleniumtransferase